jgi:hypothetical protein
VRQRNTFLKPKSYWQFLTPPVDKHAGAQGFGAQMR